VDPRAGLDDVLSSMTTKIMTICRSLLAFSIKGTSAIGRYPVDMNRSTSKIWDLHRGLKEKMRSFFSEMDFD
jgi:hypothetical protein